MTAEELEAEFSDRAVRPFSPPAILMLATDVALELVERARAERLAVLGVDGFILREKSTQSPLEHLADYSRAVDRGDGSWDAAAAFIEARRGLGLVFEVVLGDPIAPAG